MKLRSKLFLGYLLIVIIYAALTLLPKPSPALLAQMHTTAGEVKIAEIFLVLLIVGIWYIGFYSYAKFSQYAGMIRGTADGEAVQYLKRGLLFLALWGPVNSLTSGTLNALTTKQVIPAGPATVISHYVGLIMPLIAYVFISIGARGLSQLAKQRPSFLTANVINIILIYISVIFIRLVFTAPNRAEVFHETAWPLMLTIVAPYIYMWLIGAFAAYELFLYSQKSPGLVYRKLWRQLAIGFAWLIGSSIILEFVSTGTLIRSSLHATLIVVYGLLILFSIGFVLIAQGTAKLQKIEEA